MDKASSDRLAKVHPELAARVEKTIASLAAVGKNVRVVQGLRTYAEQDMLYAQGRTRKGPVVTNAKGGQSNHNFGAACDLCPFNNGEYDWNDAEGFTLIGKHAKENGLDWGGDWKKFKDRPHVELPTGLSVASCRALYANGGLAAVWKRASEKLGVPTPSATTATKDNGVTTHPTDSTATATPSPTTASLPILRKGSKGQAVRTLQKLLGLPIDGRFGPKTHQTVTGFQAVHGLKADGVVGDKTWGALNKHG